MPTPVQPLCSVSRVEVVLSDWVPLNFQMVTFCISISLSCLGLSIGAPGPTTKPNTTQPHRWKPCLGTILIRRIMTV